MSKADALSSVQNTAFVSAEDCNTFENSMEISTHRKMYSILFNAITDAIGKPQEEATAILCKAQQNCEQIFIEATETSPGLYSVSSE